MTRPLALRPRPRRAAREPVVPMINVVFLLLIFFLMTAAIVPPAPFDVTLPEASSEDAPAQDTLYISRAGEIAFEDARGDAALAQAASLDEAPLRLTADAALDASTLARVLARLAALGVTDVALVTEGG